MEVLTGARHRAEGKRYKTQGTEVVHHPRHPYTQALIAAVPDPDPSAEIADLPIKGFVPVTPEDTQSCNFSPRCPYCGRECREIKPQLDKIGDSHIVSCFKIRD